MPVHSREKKESNHEEMEVDYQEQEASSSDDEDTESSSVSEDGDSSGGDDQHEHRTCPFVRCSVTRWPWPRRLSQHASEAEHDPATGVHRKLARRYQLSAWPQLPLYLH